LIVYSEKKEKPTLTPLTDVECTEQEDVRFETTVSGKPEPTVEWYETTNLLQCTISSLPLTLSQRKTSSEDRYR